MPTIPSPRLTPIVHPNGSRRTLLTRAACAFLAGVLGPFGLPDLRGQGAG